MREISDTYYFLKARNDLLVRVLFVRAHRYFSTYEGVRKIADVYREKGKRSIGAYTPVAYQS